MMIQILWQLVNIVLLAALIAFVVYLGILLVRVLRKCLHPTPAAPAAPEKPLEKSLGEVIRENRIRCKMTQEFIAEALNISRQSVSKWESGASVPSTANLLALSKLFGISAEELLKDAAPK